MITALCDIAHHLPSRHLTNQELAASYPHWNIAEAEKRCGVITRHIADSTETALDLATVACHNLLARHPDLRDRLDGLIFCTQTPDYPMPGNAFLLHQHLKLPEVMMAFDLNLACSGFTYALGLAHSLIQSKMLSNVLVVTAETYSKLISPEDRGTRMLFGDGAAATWVSGEDAVLPWKGQIVDLLFGTSGSGWKAFTVPAGGMRCPKTAETARLVQDKSGNRRSAEHIHMDGLAVLNFVRTKVVDNIQLLLQRNQLQVQDIDQFVFHQASHLALDSLTQRLKLPQDRVFSHLADIGNTVSASIPIALQAAIAQGKIATSDKVLISGFGVGLSWGSALLQF